MTGDFAGVRHLDPRSRVIAVAAGAGTVVALDGAAALAAALALAFALLLAVRPPWRRTLARLAAVDGILLATLATLPFTVPGPTAAHIAGLSLSEPGLIQAATIGARALTVVTLAYALLGGLTWTALGHALGRLGLPARLVALYLFTVRYIDVLGDETRRLCRAMAARAFRPRNRWHTWRSYGHLVGMILVRSLERAERVLAAMKCRGWTGRMPALDAPPWRLRDTLFLTALVPVLATLLLADQP